MAALANGSSAGDRTTERHSPAQVQETQMFATDSRAYQDFIAADFRNDLSGYSVHASLCVKRDLPINHQRRLQCNDLRSKIASPYLSVPFAPNETSSLDSAQALESRFHRT
jgi:hypothetical protein